MEKDKLNSTVVPIVISLICIVLAINVGIANSKLNFERAERIRFNAQIVDLEAQISDVTAEYQDHVRIVSDLQYSLDMTRRELDEITQEADSLRTSKADLESKVEKASKALAPLSEATAE